MADEYTSDPAEIIARSQNAQDFSGVAQAATDRQPTWAEFRRARASAAAGGGDPVMGDVTQAHHQALADATKMAQIADHRLSTYHAAQMMADTGGFLNEVHGIHASDPEFEQKIMQLHAKYPMNRVTGEQMRPLMEGRQLHLKSSGELALQKQEELDTKHVYDAISKGLVTPEEVQVNPTTGRPANPDLWDVDQNGNGRLNVSRVRLLAAARASGQAPGGVKQQPLTEQENAILKMYPDSKSAQKLITASDDDPLMKAHKTLFWNAIHKINGSGGQPSASATPAAPSAPQVGGFIPPP